MQQTQEHAVKERQKTYYPLPPWENPLAIRFFGRIYFAYLAVRLIVAWIVSNLQQQSLGWAIFDYVILGMLLAAFLTWAQWRDMEVAINSHGIAFHYHTRYVQAAWEEIKSIGLIPRHALIGGEGLLLQRSPIRWRSVWRAPWELPLTFIPLAWFDARWRNGEIGNDVRQYAPSLMDK